MNPDSSLTAKAFYEKDGMVKDTIIKYYQLIKIQNYLINKLIANINSFNSDIENVKIVLSDSTEEIGPLFTINENRVTALNAPNRKTLSF